MEDYLKAVNVAEEQRKFVLQVYLWMTIALFTTGVIAFVVANSLTLIEFFYTNPVIFYGLIIAELVLVAVLSGLVKKMSSTTAIVVFFMYSALNGVTFASIFLVYDIGSIASTFFITAGTFGIMCAYGYFTKKDLSGIGNIAFMALIGIILASVVNMFIMNNTFYLLISALAVVIFVVLTAWDTQKIKNMSYSIVGRDDAELETKGSIIGALTLYLDFVNIFLYLLRLFGKRR